MMLLSLLPRSYSVSAAGLPRTFGKAHAHDRQGGGFFAAEADEVQEGSSASLALVWLCANVPLLFAGRTNLSRGLTDS